MIFFILLFICCAEISAQVYCPDAASILPCECVEEENLMVLNPISVTCRGVESADQIAKIFAQPFPVNTLESFTIISCDPGVTSFAENILGEKTTREAHIQDCPGLTSFDPNIFSGTEVTLRFIELYNVSSMAEIVFPNFLGFDSLTEFRVIISAIREIQGIPLLPNLQTLLFDNNSELSRLAPLPALPALENFISSNSKLTLVEPFTFHALPNIRDIDLLDNKISILTRDSFALSREIVDFDYIGLNNNLITTVEPGAFVGFFNNTLLNLWENKLVTLEEEAFTDIIESMMANVSGQGGYIDVRNSVTPFACDCSIAWIVRDPAKKKVVQGLVFCENGLEFSELPPTWFDGICP